MKTIIHHAVLDTSFEFQIESPGDVATAVSIVKEFILGRYGVDGQERGAAAVAAKGADAAKGPEVE
jgi:hypothetical protein